MRSQESECSDPVIGRRWQVDHNVVSTMCPGLCGAKPRMRCIQCLAPDSSAAICVFETDALWVAHSPLTTHHSPGRGASAWFHDHAPLVS